MARKPKVVLYNPRTVFYTMPLSVLAVGSCLDRDRFDVRVIDGRLEADPVARVLEELDGALCLGVSVLTGAPIGDALHILRAAKAAKPDVTTICGGWHPSLFPTEMLEEPTIDVTVQGQGEATFTELVGRLERGEPLEGVAGIAVREPDGPTQHPDRPLMPMDVFPPVDYSLIPVEDYFELKGSRQLDYVSSTGCPFRCAFCADPFVHKRGWQALGPERVADELEALWDRYRFDDVNFQDETFFTYKRRVTDIAEALIERQLPITWAGTMRADQGVRLGEDAFELCVRSGMRRVLIGVESGSPDMLKRITKDTRVEQVLESADLCARHGVSVIFSFIVGFPGETDDDVMQTLELVKRLRAMSPLFETPIFYYKPYPGSALSAGLEDVMPQSLDEWAGFDYVQGEAGPWVSAETYEFVERFKFYNRYAWGSRRWVRRPLQALARWRCRRNRYGWPVEKAMMQRLRPEQELS